MRTICSLVMLLSIPALADQCAWVKKAQAVRAAALLKERRVVEWCEPCGDAHPVKTAVQTVRTVTVERTNDPAFHEVFVNGKPVDLAYLFVELRGAFRNVAGEVGCPAHDVSKQVTPR